MLSPSHFFSVRTARSFAAMLLFVTVSLSCGKKDDFPAFEAGQLGSLSTAEIPSVATDEVQVIAASPQGQTSGIGESATISVTFNQPMIELDDESQMESSKGIIKFSPEIKGIYRWLGTRTLIFTPADTLPFSASFTATIEKGTKSLSGKALQADYAFQFSTPKPRITQMYPSSDYVEVGLQDDLYLRFNQKVSPAFADNISIKGDKGSTVKFTTKLLSADDIKSLVDTLRKQQFYGPTYTLESGKADGLMVLKLSQPLTVGETYTLTFSGAESPQDFKFATFKEFQYTGTAKNSYDLSPYDDLQLRFSNSVSGKDLEENLIFSPKLDTNRNPKGWLGTYPSHEQSIYPRLEANTNYTVTISKNLTDRFGNKLGRDVTLKVHVTDYPASASIPQGFGVVENDFGSTDPNIFPHIPISSINVNDVTIESAVLSPEDVISVGNHLYEKPKVSTKSNFVAIPMTKNKGSVQRFDLRQTLNGKSSGFVFLRQGKTDNDYQQMVLQVTSLGVTAKFSAEGSIVMVTKLRNASPVADATVKLYESKTKKVVWQGTTDKDGVAAVPSYESLGLSLGYDNQLYIFVSQGDEVAYTSSSYSDGIELYRFSDDIGSNYDSESRANVMGKLFTERGIYRTGETVYFKGTVREKKSGVWRVPSNKFYTYTIQNSRGENVIEKAVSIDGTFGSFADSLVLKTKAPLGTYFISLSSAGKGREQAASGSFRVEAYKPGTFAVKVNSTQKDFVAKETFDATIEGRYLFGAAMSGDKVSWSLQRGSERLLEFDGYDGYFWQPLDWNRKQTDRTSDLLGSGSGVLASDGTLKVSRKLDLPIDAPSTLTLEAEVTDPSRQTSAGRLTVNLNPAEYYIGLKPQTTFLKENSPLPIDVVTLSPDGKQIGKSVSVQVVHRQWISVKRAGVGGRYESVSEQIDSVIFKKDISTSEKEAAHFTVPLGGAGLYFIRAESKDGKGNIARSETYAYTYGGGYVAWERFDDDRIRITPNKKSYKPGETATIMVQSPYEQATALVTIEREGVLSKKVFELKGTAPPIEIPITAEYLPNIYVSVILIKGRSALPGKDANDLGKPSFKIGYTKLSVDPQSKHLQVSVKTSKPEYKAGEIVEAEVSVLNQKGQPVQSEVALAAVDAGVLNLIGYTLPDLFTDFYRERSLGVRTSESLIHLIGQRNYGEKGKASGGGGGEGGGGLATRQKFVATAYWNPSVLTGSNGKATVRFKLPDNLTTFRLMAAAQSTDAAFGTGKTDFLVNQPLTMIAALPRFARIGDKFEAGVVVHNYTKDATNVKISMTAKGIKAVDAKPEESISLAAGASKEVRFKFEAETEGTATFRFEAHADNGSADAIQLSIPIQTPLTKETLALFGNTENSTSETVKIPKATYANLGEITVQGSSTALVGLREAAAYLFEYPYGCLEQKSSGILPYILANDLIGTFKLKTQADTAKGGSRAVVEKTLAEFEKYKSSQGGGFGYWPSTTYTNEYVSVYATYTMLKAKQAGFKVDESVLQYGINHLSQILRKQDESFYGYYSASITKAFALYVLALNHTPDRSYSELFYQDRDKLPLDAKSYLLRALVAEDAPLYASATSTATPSTSSRVEELSRSLKNLVKIQSETAHFEDGSDKDYIWTFGSPVKTTATVFVALTEAGQTGDLASKVVTWLLGSQKNGRWRTTQENIFVLDALNTYFRKYENVTPDFKAKVSLAAETLLDETFKGRSLDAKVNKQGLEKFAKGDALKLQFEKQGAGKFFYGVRLSYYPTYAVKSRDNGISVLKTIEQPDKKSDKYTFEAGEVVKITLQVAVPEEMHFIAVDDPLPAGLEAINPKLLTSARLPDTPAASNDGEGGDGDYNDNGGDYDGGGGKASGEDFDYIDLHDDRVTLFAERLSAGLHTFTYYARATTYGTFTLPPTYAEEMYSPEIFGRTATHRVTVAGGK
jgi:uncharacterized protein YfaS (alpha-2-macroglobulin family)